MPKVNILLKKFSLNPPSKKIYITQDISMTIANSVEILCKNEYYNS